MVSADAIRTAVGILGNAIALGLFLSPVPTFVKIWKKGSVQEFSPIPYVATLLNCMMWVVYGLPMVHPHSMLVITINGSGLAIELSYVLLFIVYSSGSKRLKVLVMLLAETAFVGVVALLVLTLAHTHERRSMIVGVLCVFFGTMMYAAPLSVMIGAKNWTVSVAIIAASVHSGTRRSSSSSCVENGDPEQERGVHAALPLACFLLQRRLLDRLRTHPFRSVHHNSQWSGGDVCSGAAGTVRHVLQVDAEAGGGEEEEGGAGADGGGGGEGRRQQDCERPYQWRQQRGESRHVMIDPRLDDCFSY
ncbi:bidirectional sugar transporter SWEET4-like isoform X1 [Musa acuminata AAA Group]|uniref:bidirectional sugar transporter SWEET4-like isoform X1 n=1 Tax=Musa acuminata AAA Group TaxID=214697 RepID=UPI0031E0BE45